MIRTTVFSLVRARAQALRRSAQVNTRSIPGVFARARAHPPIPPQGVRSSDAPGVGGARARASAQAKSDERVLPEAEVEKGRWEQRPISSDFLKAVRFSWRPHDANRGIWGDEEWQGGRWLPPGGIPGAEMIVRTRRAPRAVRCQMNDERTKETRPCAVCGMPTASKYGVCQRNAVCRNERRCRALGYVTRLFCAGCGGPMRSHCKWRFCLRNPQCRSLHNAEMLRVDGDRIRAIVARSAAKHAEKYRARDLVHRRLRGVGPPGRGHHHAGWMGGRIVFCWVCGSCAGWRNPSQIRRRKRFLCKEHGHGHDNWKWNLSKPQFQPEHAVPRVPQTGGDC